MTKEEMNNIIKQSWVRNLQKEEDLPTDIGRTYKNWLRGLIQQAQGMLQQVAQQQQPSQEQPQPQEQGA